MTLFTTVQRYVKTGAQVGATALCCLAVGLSFSPCAWAQKSASKASSSPATAPVESVPTPIHVAAQPATPSALKQLEQYRQHIKTISGNFTQNSAQMGQSSGRFLFAQSGFFRWEVLKPHVQTIMVARGFIYQYDADLAQLSVQKEQMAKGTQPLQIVFGNTPLAQYFNIKDLGMDQGYNWVDLVPKNNDFGVKDLKIGLQLGVPFKVEFTDFFGNVSTITFSELKPNVAISEADQGLQVPKGTSILRLGQ